MTVRILVLTALSLTFFSCQKSEKDTLYEAQACLNEAPAEQARACVSELASMSSPEANRLKCSAVFISEGYREASDFISAMDKLKDDGAGCPSGTCSGTFSAMGALNFSKGDNTQASARNRNLAVADEAFSLCSQSNSKGYSQVSSIFKIGTVTTMTAYSLGGVSGDAAELEAALQDILSVSPTDPPAAQAAKEAIGEVALVAYDSVCVGTQEPSESTIKYCDELAAAKASGSSAADIGACLLNKINDKDYVCPP